MAANWPLTALAAQSEPSPKWAAGAGKQAQHGEAGRRCTSSLSLGAGSSAIDHGRGARRRRFARPPSFAALSPSRHNNTLSCSYHLRLTDRASEMRAHFLSCHSHPSPPSYPRTLTPQAMPVVLRTDPELLTLYHCVLVHLFAARLERQRQRKPRMSCCCTAALLLHVALACPRRPPAVGWARSGLLALLVASSQPSPSRPGVPCPLV